MAANTSPIFVLKPKIGLVSISTANANRDGTGTLGSVITGATDGTRIHKITVKAIGTTTAGMIRLFIYDGVDTRLWKEIPVTAITPSASVEAFESVVELLGERALFLPSTWVLKAGTHNAEAFHIVAEAGEYS